MNNLMAVVTSAVAKTIMEALTKKLLATLGSRLMTNAFKATLKAMMKAYTPIVGSLFFTIVVGLNIWVYSRPVHKSFEEAFWLFAYLLELVLSMFLVAYSFARVRRLKPSSSGRGKLR